MNPGIDLPEKLVPVFDGKADIRGAFGGRGSGKTRSFAAMTAVRAVMWAQAGREGIILCCRQFQNSLDESSLEEVKGAIRSEPWLADYFEIGEKYVKTIDGRVSYKFQGLERNVDSVKSKSHILLCWVDEADPVTEEAWTKLIPSLREEDSELWVTWNPERKNSATHKQFRLTSNPLQKIVEVNWRDNPWFPAILERRRLRDMDERPDQYNHIWEGDFVTVMEGAYYAKQLNQARAQKRICFVPPDPLMQIRAHWDIGGTGTKADACAIVIDQFVNREVRVLNYYESVGQELGYHLNWLRSNGYENALCVLPHDGGNHEKIIRITYEGAIRAASFKTKVIPNQGAGAALKRVEAARRVFPAIRFNETTTQPLLDALGWYHEKRDPDRNVGLGPEHDWASHGADAFGEMCIDYETPREKRPPQSRSDHSFMGV